MSYLAHTENAIGHPHLLHEHLRSVGDLAARFAARANPQLAEAARWAGLLHDLGKYRDEFQQYLAGARDGGIDTHHAVYGAALAKARGSVALAYAIAAHHAGLYDRADLKRLFSTPAYDLKNSLPPLAELFKRELGAEVPELLPRPDFVPTDPRGDTERCMDLSVRMIFSALVDADFLDTEEHYECRARRNAPPLDAASARTLLEKLRVAKDKKARAAAERGGAADIGALRNAIFEQCERAGQKGQGFFSLTVPTGGGKTLSGMAFALAHAARHDLRRVIVVIPYLSIIEQNAVEYREILDPDGEGIVVENHSAVVVPAEEEEEDRSTEARVRSPLALAAENWDAPVVVTTAVQFVESLFSNKPSRCRKLHNVARSVVILDEAQTLPSHLLDPLLSALRELQRNYGVSFVFSSATQPAFRRQFSLRSGFDENEVEEITEGTGETFRRLRRVRFELPARGETRAWGEVAAEMRLQEQVLCVVNTRRHAFTLWQMLRGELGEESQISLFHLSSAMCAEHRLDVIGEMHNPREGSIRWRLKEGLPCRVVSTQLIEAGVDLDFPVLYRALGPLDSIVQAAGRCNRENDLRDEEGRPALGRVVVFVPEEDAVPGGVYKTATEETANLLHRTDREALATDPNIFADYFSRIYGNVATDHVKAGETTIQDDRANLDFRSAARKAKVIEDSGVAVIAPYGDAPDIIKKLRGRRGCEDRPRFNRDDLRSLQRFIVNVRRKDFEQLQRMGQLKPLLPNSRLELQVLDEASYEDDLGVRVNGRSPGDFIL
jgi:CRISPR-associated endonuclease/helicase Cas3